jgi:hypothetical protein
MTPKITGNNDVMAREQRFELRLPGRHLRCDCGHRLAAYDFDIIEPHRVRAICSRCHHDLFTLEIR